MTSFFLLANSFDRFHSEIASSRPIDAATCVQCGYPVHEAEPQAEYFWDTEYGNPLRSLNAGHTVFWSEFAMFIQAGLAEEIENLMLPIDLLQSRCLTATEVRSRFGIETTPINAPELKKVRSTVCLPSNSSDLPVCASCGRFSAVAWKLRGMRVNKCDAERVGLFRISQNRGEPMFVTEEVKQKLEDLDLKGLGFYPAGWLV